MMICGLLPRTSGSARLRWPSLVVDLDSGEELDFELKVQVRCNAP
jgi:hypothetical protein